MKTVDAFAEAIRYVEQDQGYIAVMIKGLRKGGGEGKV